MALVPAKCTQCGANIEVDNSQEAGICKYCGTAFIVEKAINNYNTYITNNNNFAGANINVTGINVDNLLVLAKNAREIGNNEEARDYYSRILEAQPTNCEALVGKGVCTLYSSNLANIRSDEMIGYIAKAIEYKRNDTNSSTEETVKFTVESARELYAAATAIYQASHAHYNEYWKLESSAPELWDRLGKVIKIFLFVVALTENKEIRQLEDAEFCYLESMKFVVICCTDICKQRQYVSGIVNPGQLLEMEEKTEIKPNESLHKTYMDLYDNMCSKIKEVDQSYQPQEINRNTQIKGACYIATCVYGSYDCPEVWTLRRFRDYTLDEVWYGRMFIKCYYAISPTLVKWFGKKVWFRNFWKKRLDEMVCRLNEKGVSCKKYNDKY